MNSAFGSSSMDGLDRGGSSSHLKHGGEAETSHLVGECRDLFAAGPLETELLDACQVLGLLLLELQTFGIQWFDGFWSVVVAAFGLFFSPAFEPGLTMRRAFVPQGQCGPFPCRTRSVISRPSRFLLHLFREESML